MMRNDKYIILVKMTLDVLINYGDKLYNLLKKL